MSDLIPHPDPRQDPVALLLSGKSKRTREGYGAAIAGWLRWAGALDDTGECATVAKGFMLRGRGAVYASVLAYRAALIDQGLQPATINQRLAAIRALCKVARLSGLIDWTPEVPNVRSRAYRDTSGPTLDRIRSLVEWLEARADGSRTDARTLLLVRLMFDLGLRRVECHRLQLYDVIADPPALMVWGKGRSKREKLQVPLPPEPERALALWLRHRGGDPGPLIVGKGNAPMTAPAINMALTDACKAAGITPIRCHGLRHAAITAIASDPEMSLGDVVQFGRWEAGNAAKTAGVYIDQANPRMSRLSLRLAGKLKKEGGATDR